MKAGAAAAWMRTRVVEQHVQLPAKHHAHKHIALPRYGLVLQLGQYGRLRRLRDKYS